jgi:predicted acylesterase/phospholipase RssA
MKRALVLSGGGLFGAWQAGAWRALADRFQPDLVVGASVGSLNGYAIAGGATPDELAEFWRQPASANFSRLPLTIRALMERYSPRVEYAVVLTDLLRLKPRVFQGDEITWRHLAASCAIPGVLKQYKIGGRWHSDGGLLNPLPVWAAVELGATQIVALHALPVIPALWMRPFVKGFRHVAGHNPPLPPGVELTMISTGSPIGSMTDALRWKRENIERWLEMGHEAVENISIRICSEP